MNKTGLFFVLFWIAVPSSAWAYSNACRDSGDLSDPNCTFTNDEIMSCGFAQATAQYHCVSTPGRPGYCYRDPKDHKVYRVSSGNTTRVCQTAALKNKTGAPRCSVILRDCPFVTKGKKNTKLTGANHVIAVFQNGLANASQLTDMTFTSGFAVPYSWEADLPAVKAAYPVLAQKGGRSFQFDDSATCQKVEIDADGQDVYNDGSAAAPNQWRRKEAPAPELSAEQCCSGGQDPSGNYRYETREEFWTNFCTLTQTTLKQVKGTGGKTGVPIDYLVSATKSTAPKAIKFKREAQAAIEVQYLK